uniref:hypothetical protein n=1 Tax=Ruminococcus sp. TaxID=41978 RepID=UPI0025CE33E5
MKKIISIITSAVMTLCIASVFIQSAFVCSAEDKKVLTDEFMLTDAFDGITAELDGDGIRFITEYDNIIVSTEKEISLSCTDNGYLFRPMHDGKYVVSIMHELPGEPPNYGSIWLPPMESFNYEIEISDGVIGITGIHRLCDEAGKDGLTLIESFYADGTYSKVDSKFFMTTLGVCNLIVCLSYKMDPLFMYYINQEADQSAHIGPVSFIMSNDENAEAWYIQGDYKKVRKGNGWGKKEFTTIGEASIPAKLFDIIDIPYGGSENINGSLRIVLNEGKRSKIYDFDYINYEPLPSTLKITECPENDINADGSFNVADVVELQKYLLG